jgi:hypothetical protein
MRTKLVPIELSEEELKVLVNNLYIASYTTRNPPDQVKYFRKAANLDEKIFMSSIVYVVEHSCDSLSLTEKVKNSIEKQLNTSNI